MSDRRSTIKVATRVSPAGRAKVGRDTPFRILLLGDFHGAAGEQTGQLEPLAERRPRLVDPDNMAEVMQRMQASVRIPSAVGAEPVVVPLGNLDDLHPDSLIQKISLFEQFRRLRGELLDASTFDRAADEVRGWASWDESTDTTPQPDRQPETPHVSGPLEIPDNLLDQTLEATQPGAAGVDAGGPASQWREAIRDIVRPYAVPGKPPRQVELLECVDQAISTTMNLVLHAPAVQALEAAWRSVQFLVRRLPLGTQLKLFLLDISKNELATDLAAAEESAPTLVRRLLVDESVGSAGGQPWAVIGGLYNFGATVTDAQLLARMAGIARQAGAPFLAGALSDLVGCPSFATAPDPREWTTALAPEAEKIWLALRRQQEAEYLGLVAPRLLLRMPYGAHTSPVDTFSFEEMPGEPVHENYLWGNGCVPCICVLAESFARFGWQVQPKSRFEIDDLPLHVFERDEESVVYPPSEAFLTERAVAAAAEHGITTLAAVRHRDAVQINGIRSLAGGALGGPWD